MNNVNICNHNEHKIIENKLGPKLIQKNIHWLTRTVYK